MEINKGVKFNNIEKRLITRQSNLKERFIKKKVDTIAFWF